MTKSATNPTATTAAAPTVMTTAVPTVMTTSATGATSTLTAPDGRTVAFDVRGPADGPIVLFSAAAPGSRLFDPDPRATAQAGVRLVTLDRPGYGLSDPMPDGRPCSVADAADDAARVLDALGASEAGLAGWSAGGRVVLALAARRPELARAVAVIATPAPDEDVPWIPEEQRAMISDLRRDPASAPAALARVFASLPPAEYATGFVSGGPGDEALLAARPRLRADLVDMLAESFRQGAAGIASDICSYTVLPWGFDPRSVGARTRLVYGQADQTVGPEHATWWADQLPAATVEVVPGAGHLVVSQLWGDLLNQLR
ncbi:alpha/beta fold hydrolase [Parafrankia elaeagni]|uniref:alpha/beta fold hydrolase n=1 Tax=Parafrankia elaeagni TaxID=222534 RepID=UPI00036D05E6|nr:alpha/beta hydrolase [Parafrankia elaeagni]